MSDWTTTGSDTTYAQKQPRKDTMTNAEEFEKAMECETEEEASRFKAEATTRRVKAGIPRRDAHEMVLESFGYMAGYYGPEVRAKVERLFGAVHPIYGKLRPTTEEGLFIGWVSAKLGQEEGKKLARLLYERGEMGNAEPPTPADTAKE